MDRAEGKGAPMDRGDSDGPDSLSCTNSVHLGVIGAGSFFVLFKATFGQPSPYGEPASAPGFSPVGGAFFGSPEFSIKRQVLPNRFLWF
jgi:hypothetical protein